MIRIRDCILYSAALLVSAKKNGIYEPIHHHHESRHLEARQAMPITTTSTNCPDNDSLFYATGHNYTYQIQCSTIYSGQQIIIQVSLGLTACILECASYNHNNSSATSFCVGVNFNAETDGSSGDCTLFEDVSLVPNQASEEGSIEDAALLIYGPTGQIFAAPEMQPSNAVGGLLTNSLIFTSQSVAPSSFTPISISTAFVTSVVTVISCAPGIANWPANGISTSTSLLTTSALLTPVMTTSVSPAPVTQSISISLGGMRPLTASNQITHGSGASPSYSQATQTSIVPFTEYHVTTFLSCTRAPTSSSCATSVTTQTITGLRTEISCSPGTCSGVMLATGTLLWIPGVFTGGCIVQSV